jgi:hypothetical protein
MPLLYCANGKVIAWYDSDKGVSVSEYGPDATIIPWDNMRTLQKTGPAPKPGTYDDRQYAAPVLKGPSELIPYAKFKQSRLVGGGVTVDLGAKVNPRYLSLATDASNLVLLHSLFIKATAHEVTGEQYSVVGRDHLLHALNGDQLRALSNAVTSFVARTNTVLAKIIDAINQGFVENQAMVDKPPKPLLPWPDTAISI